MCRNPARPSKLNAFSWIDFSVVEDGNQIHVQQIIDGQQVIQGEVIQDDGQLYEGQGQQIITSEGQIITSQGQEGIEGQMILTQDGEEGSIIQIQEEVPVHEVAPGESLLRRNMIIHQ